MPTLQKTTGHSTAKVAGIQNSPDIQIQGTVILQVIQQAKTRLFL